LALATFLRVGDDPLGGVSLKSLRVSFRRTEKRTKAGNFPKPSSVASYSGFVMPRITENH
jgi:hypothetical protein